MPKINSLEVVHQDTNKDSYDNLHDLLVDLKKSLVVNQEVVDENARASIENLLEMYANDKETFLRSLQTLTAEFEESKAQYSEETFLLASQLEAQAKRTSILTSQTATQFASVTEYAEAVASEVERKVSTYSQATPPTDNLTYGDLWYDTSDNNKLYRWNGLVWVETSDSSGLESFISGQYTEDYNAISSQVDSKAETWFQTTDPSTAWTTQDIRDLHDKDLWYNSSTNLLKIYVASSNTWTTVQDQAAIDAAAAASTAQNTADGKIVTFVQYTAPTAEGVGDLWMDTSNNRKMYRWNGSYWEAVDDARIARTYSRWGVNVNSNGHVAGIQLNADDIGTSEFTVLADNFRVYKSGYTSSPMFSVGPVNGITTVSINGNLVVDGSIVTKGIANNSVTTVTSANGTYSAGVSFTTDVAAPVYILGVFTQGSGRSGSPVGLYLNGVQQTSEQPQEGTVGAMARVVNVGAGTHTASIGAYYNVGDMRCNVLVIVCKR